MQLPTFPHTYYLPTKSPLSSADLTHKTNDVLLYNEEYSRCSFMDNGARRTSAKIVIDRNESHDENKKQITVDTRQQRGDFSVVV